MALKALEHQAILESVESEYATASGANPSPVVVVGTACDAGTELFSGIFWEGEKLKEKKLMKEILHQLR